MISRREVVTAGVLGTIGAGAPASAEGPAAAVAQQQDLSTVSTRLDEIQSELETLNSTVKDISRVFSNSMASGLVAGVREVIEKYLRTGGRFPEYLEVGSSVFYDVYDWHVRQQQPLQVTQLADQRLMIKFMYTQLIMRWELSPTYIGAPYDK